MCIMPISHQIAPSNQPVSIANACTTIYKHLARIYDSTHGGFGRAPKFPSPSQTMHFLARYAALHMSDPTSNKQEEARHARDMAVNTMINIYNGGIRDVVGGGFSRYSVDDHWHVPHCKSHCTGVLFSMLLLI